MFGGCGGALGQDGGRFSRDDVAATDLFEAESHKWFGQSWIKWVFAQDKERQRQFKRANV
jgi:hypothetical protein